jgi:CDP-paratose 2-epimerase
VQEAFKDCDYIVYTAAQPAMAISIERPELDLTSNVVGTFNVLECAVQRTRVCETTRCSRR